MELVVHTQTIDPGPGLTRRALGRCPVSVVDEPRAASAARDLYLWASEPEGHIRSRAFTDELRRELRTVRPGTDLARLREDAEQWASAETLRYRALAGGIVDEDTRTALVDRVLMNNAPLGLRYGAWLQWAVGPADGEDELSSRILRLYADDIGVGRPRADRGSGYRRLLEDAGLAGRVASDAQLVADRRVTDLSFRLPALLLAMSRYTSEFLPELLGADLCLRQVGLLPSLAVVGSTAHAAALDLASARGSGVPALDQSSALVDAYLDQHGSERDRLLTGFAWTLRELRSWSGDLLRIAVASGDPAFEMAELLRLRSREASVYHQGFPLADRPLAEWFADRAVDPDAFLDVLAASRLVKPGRPEQSPLLRGLIGPRGPMFRVFTDDDLRVIRRWIAALPSSTPRATVTVAEPDDSRPLPVPLPPGVDQVPSDAASPTLRDAYAGLLRRTVPPELHSFAKDYARQWLDRSARGIGRVKNPPVRWSPGMLRPWLQQQHDRHGEQFEASAELAVPSREEVIDSFVQLAPLNLIDGGWLSGFVDYRHASSEAGHFLFATFWDELGNGQPELNHPRIYRTMLSGMGVDLPETSSPNFAHWAGFRDESFELPVFWLSVARFPETFLPELLGLNLAMELSGVGGSYRRDRVALSTYRFSTRYADIHNTIDNIATGHSAWAVDAIDAYLKSLSSSLGPEGAAGAWERVRVGFRSLRPPASA